MPNQVEGTWNGKHVYFRARHGEWDLALDDNEVANGEEEQAGWWTEEQTTTFVLALLEKFC